MTLATALVLGFLFHVIGDYLMQNDWMAQNKTKAFLPAFIHATIYSLPFLFITDIEFWPIVYVTHYLIDRYRLAVYWIKLANWNWSSTNFGSGSEKPIWMSVWLMISIDNTFHLIFNTIAIWLSFS